VDRCFGGVTVGKVAALKEGENVLIAKQDVSKFQKGEGAKKWCYSATMHYGATTWIEERFHVIYFWTYKRHLTLLYSKLQIMVLGVIVLIGLNLFFQVEVPLYQ